MKKIIIYFITVFSILFLAVSCDFIFDFQSDSSKLTCKANSVAGNTINVDSIVFVGSYIRWFNGATNEVIFTDSIAISKLQLSENIKCYLDKDSLFAFTFTSSLMSSVVNDLVLYHNLFDGRYYFDDGYPLWIDNLSATTLRAQNKEKRAAAWAKFILQLKMESKYLE